MPDSGPHAARPRGPWRYAILGGLVSVPLTVAYNWQTLGGAEFSLGFVLVGGVLAGFLARRAAADAVRAGFGAGVIGSLVGYGWLLGTLVESAASFGAAWSFPPATAVLVVVFSVIVLGAGGVGGLAGGVVGGWLARLLPGAGSTAVEA